MCPQHVRGAQVEDKEQLAESLQQTIQEAYQQQSGSDAKTQGLRQMVDQIKKLSDEKRYMTWMWRQMACHVVAAHTSKRPRAARGS